MLESFFSSSTFSQKAKREKELHEQIQNLEILSLELNDMLSHMRAMVRYSSDKELLASNKLEQLKKHSESEKEDLLGLLGSEVQDSWKHSFSVGQAMRKLYPQLIEFKRRYLHEQIRSLQLQIKNLEESSQDILNIQLQNVIQGTITAGIHYLESEHYNELQNTGQDHFSSESFFDSSGSVSWEKQWKKIVSVEKKKSSPAKKETRKKSKS